MVRRRASAAALALLPALSVAANPTWCLSMGGLGPIRAGMPVEQVLALADFPGMEGKTKPQQCWHLRYQGGPEDFQLMIIDGVVVRIELRGVSRLHTFAGAHLGTSEEELEQLYGARLEIQPAKYDEHGHTITLRSGDGEYGLRFETSQGKVTAIQSGPWEHLNYVEGCG